MFQWTIEDVEAVTIMHNIGAMTRLERDRIFVEFATQVEPPMFRRVRDRLRKQ